MDSTKKLFFLINPAASNHRVKQKWPSIDATLTNRHFSYDYKFTEHKGHGMALIKNMDLQAYSAIIAVGGDGTFHELVNGLLNNPSSKKPPIGILPIGTGNDFIKTHRIPKWGEDWLDMLQKETTILHDIGVVQYKSGAVTSKRFFANIAGLFFDAYIVRESEKETTQISNTFHYLKLLLTKLMSFKPPRASINWVEGQWLDEYYTANVGIGKYSGGGMQLVPHAKQDGRLAVTLASSMAPIRVLLNIPLFFTGHILRHPKVKGFYAEELTISPKGKYPVYLEADGEFLGIAPCSFSILPRCVELIVPG